MRDPTSQLVATLMAGFAERTGLTGNAPPRRYLWTDAFAVCNLIADHEELATRLVHQVHRVLGRHRAEDRRSGWISGLDEAEGAAHPTLGGLRIGKPLPERGPREPFDERLEWERDGQYFHYLTKWMHALDQLARATRDQRLSVWAGELAETAHRRFAHRTPAGPQLYWKMSIDLMRPLVPSMGHHDPLDGYLTSLGIETTAAAWAPRRMGPSLTDAIADYAAMIDPHHLATADPLGLGGLLVDAYRLSELVKAGTRGATPVLIEALLVGALLGLRQYTAGPDLRSPAQHRIAFRELGLAIGLAALAAIDRQALTARARGTCVGLDGFAECRQHIHELWLRPDHRAARAWIAHEDINDVMLATSLAPEGFLLRPPMLTPMPA